MQINPDFYPFFILESVFILKIRVPFFFFRQAARRHLYDSPVPVKFWTQHRGWGTLQFR